jgi:hypothetical protein
LALAVVTKFVEGNEACYITGSGQTTATTDRVLIYQKEGQVVPNKRERSESIKSLGLSKKSKSNKILTQINEDQLQESDTIAIKSMNNDIDVAIVHYAHKHPTVACDVLAKKTNACIGQIPKTSKAAQQKALRESLQLVQEILNRQCFAADEMIEMKYAS